MRTCIYAGLVPSVVFKVGQKWRENDNRFTRTVEIVGFDVVKEKVQIRYAGKSTWAAMRRFNGKSGGYSLEKDVQA